MNKRYVLSISCGNYIYSNGGTDKVIRAQRELFSKKSISYVFLFPVPKKIGGITLYGWGMNIDSEFMGIYSAEGIIKELCKLKEDDYQCLQIHTHSLWRLRLKDVEKFVDLYDCDIKMYLHDYYAVCPQGNLLYNKEYFCGETDGLCKNKQCKYYSAEYVNTFVGFYNKYSERIEFLAPSVSVADNFQSILKCDSKQIRVVKHQKLEGQYRVNWNKKLEKIKIAYIGSQSSIKGWNDFKKIIAGVNNSIYEFYYMGVGNEKIEGIKYVYTSVKEMGENAMLDNLRNNKIDMVFLLSGWPETYSYTYFESMGANCYVITNEQSGNIALEVKNNKNGRIFSNADEIIEYLSSADNVKNELFTWYKTEEYGPETLINNDEIYEIVMNGKYDTKKVLYNGKKLRNYRKIILEKAYRIKMRM